jgi:hypothetical protein
MIHSSSGRSAPLTIRTFAALIIVAMLAAAIAPADLAAQVEPTAQDPFFTNDIIGVLKLATALAALGGAIIAAMWKLMSGKLTQADKELQDQINGVGARVDAVAHNQIASDTRQSELKERVREQELQSATLNRDVGELKSKVEQMITQGTENKVEIIAAFTQRSDALLQSIHLLDKEVATVRATMEERERLRIREMKT